MSITLKVTPEALKTKASEVENAVKEVKTHLDSIQDTVSRTSGYWTGQAGDRMRKLTKDQKDEMDEVVKRFKEHPRDLLVMAGIYEENERSLVEEEQALPTDVIV